MTLREALNQRIPRVRQAHWAYEDTYLRLPLLPNGIVGPWAELYGDREQTILGLPVGSQRVPWMFTDDSDAWEIYTGPASIHEQDPENYAKGYSEN